MPTPKPTARAVWPPEPGFFALKLVRNGWLVPARIGFDGVRWHAEIDGTIHPAHTDPALAPEVARIWTSGARVDEADYRWRFAVKAHALAHDPAHPALCPDKAMNPNTLRPLPARTRP